MDKFYSLDAAVQIPEGADLNDYKSFGNYLCSSKEIAITLKNCPFTSGGFVLHVERDTGGSNLNYTKQRIVANIGSAAEFWRTNLGNSWKNWNETAFRSDVTGLNNELLNRNVYNPETKVYYKNIYLSPTGNDNNPGTKTSPMKTITGALKKYLPSNLGIILLPGEYTESIGEIDCPCLLHIHAETPGTVTLNIDRILFYYLAGIRLSDLTINCSPASNAGLRFSYCNSVYIYNCIINRKDSGSTDALTAFYLVQAYLENCTITASSAAPIAIYAAQTSYLGVHNCTVTADNYQIDANTLADVRYFNCTFGGNGTLRARNGGSIMKKN